MNCVFDRGVTCRALTVKTCIGCRFCKTRQQLEEQNRRCSERLTRLRLAEVCHYKYKQCYAELE